MGTLVSPNYRDAPSFGYAGTLKVIDSGDVAVATGDIDNDDLVTVFRAAKGFTVIGAILEATDLDTNVAPAISLALGDAGDDDRFITGATIGRTGGVGDSIATTGCGYTFPADTDVQVKVTAGAATAAAGTIRAILIGFESAVY
jgi:hypothetical protein